MPSAVREMMKVTDEGIAMADSDVNLNMDNCDDGCATFDVQRFLRGLDAIFDAHKAPEQAEPYLQKARTEAEHSHNDAGLLTVLNETMGFYRSQGRHTDNLPIIRESLSIADHLHLQEIDPQAWATTLINAATGMRAAGQYEEAEQLYRQALDAATSAFSPHRPTPGRAAQQYVHVVQRNRSSRSGEARAGTGAGPVGAIFPRCER